MAKRPRPPKTPRRDPNQTSAAPDCDVGYCRPPRQHRFQPGKSGNPQGRPKRKRNLRTVVDDALQEMTEIREEGRSRVVSKREALVLSMLNKAVKGDPKARTALIALLRSVGITTEAPEPTSTEPVTVHDAEIIADCLNRQNTAPNKRD